MAEISTEKFCAAIKPLVRVVPYLNSPHMPKVVIDIKDEKARVANTMQYWQTDAPGVPDMQLIAEKAEWLTKLADHAPTFEYDSTDSHNSFKIADIAVELIKPISNFYDGIEEVLLKPVLVNDYRLQVPTMLFLHAVQLVKEGTDPRVIRLQMSAGGVRVTGKDSNGNLASVAVEGVYEGKPTEAFFPARELSILAATLGSDNTDFKFGAGTKARPSPLLATDERFGLTVVLSPTHR